MEKLKSRNGQVGLLVLLATIVVMTIAVALASRTASEIAISTNEEQSTSAFESAETIIERILSRPESDRASEVSNINAPNNRIGNNSIAATIAPIQGLSTNVKAGETVELKLQGAGTMTIKGWDSGACPDTKPALVVAVFYHNTSNNNYWVKRSAYDRCNARKANNGFNGTLDGADNHAKVTLEEHAIRARIKVLYSNASIEVGGQIPNQGQKITSRASSLDDQSRAIEVTEGEAMAPSIFDYAVYSAGTIKNVGP